MSRDIPLGAILADLSDQEIARSKYVCHYCGKNATTKDHIVPKSWKGGGGKNLVPACRPCNQDKGSEAPSCQCKRCKAAVHHWLRQKLPGLLKKARPTDSREHQTYLRRASVLRRRYGIEDSGPKDPGSDWAVRLYPDRPPSSSLGLGGHLR